MVKKKYLIFFGLGLTIATTIFSLSFKSRKIIKQLEEITVENNQLKLELQSYGSPVTVFTVSEDIASGNVFDENKITEISVLDSMVTDRYITDREEVKNYIYKVDVQEGTPLTYDIFTQEQIDETERFCDIVADVFPVEPRVGQYYDLRLVTPKGIDYIVLSKLRVHSFYGSAIKVILNEEEIHQYQSALVDAFLNPGTYLYVTVYVEPSLQKEASAYYPPSEEVIEAMELDPNIANIAQKSMKMLNRLSFESELNMSEEEINSVTSGRSNVVSKIEQAKAKYESALANTYQENNTGSGVTIEPDKLEVNDDSENNSGLDELDTEKQQMYEDAANFLNEEEEGI